MLFQILIKKPYKAGRPDGSLNGNNGKKGEPGFPSPEIDIIVGCISGKTQVNFIVESGQGQNGQHGSDGLKGEDGVDAPNLPLDGKCDSGCKDCGGKNCKYSRQKGHDCGVDGKGKQGSNGGDGGDGGDGGNGGSLSNFKVKR